MIADEDDLTWTFVDSFECENTVTIWTDAHDETVIVLSEDMFSVEDVPELIKALQAAYDFHMRRVHD